MTAKKLLVVAILAVVALVYYYQYRDHFERSDIAVSVNMRPKFQRGRPVLGADGQPQDMVVFALGKEFKLTSLKIVPVSDALTNKYPHPVWDLVSESNSVPTIDFEYGGRIRGMHPVVKDAIPDSLQPNTDYRILVQAGAQKGQHDFKTRGESAASE